MRRFLQLCGIIILGFIIYAISSISLPHLVPPAPPPPDEVAQTPPPIIIPIDHGPSHATIEYGQVRTIKNNIGPLFTYIRYPHGGNATDDIITEWVYSKNEEFINGFEAVQEEVPTAIGEVNIHFDSYLIDNKYAGVRFSGEYAYTLASRPEDVVKVYNIDLTRGVILTNNEILDRSQLDLILELLRERTLAHHPDTSRYLGDIDESWLRHLVIGHEGIIVVLERLMVLPDTFPTLTVLLPYEDLGSALLIRTEPPLDAPPTPVPTPSPEPVPDPDDIEDPDEPEDDPVFIVPPQSGSIDPSRPMIALSFDDGPGVYTDKFLDLVEEYNVRVTFCTIGNLVNSQRAALVRAVSLGSEVIGHSWDHKNMAKLSADNVRQQIMDTSDLIASVTGADPVFLFRPPYGELSDTMREVSAELGFAMVNWNVDPRDWDTKDADSVYHAVLGAVSDGSIILSHEIYRSTLDAYARLIPELLLRGFQIVTVSELLYHRHGELTPGHVYYDGRVR